MPENRKLFHVLSDYRLSGTPRRPAGIWNLTGSGKSQGPPHTRQPDDF